MEAEYKALQGVDDKCILCPENSNSTGVGALSCDCLDGYYRAEDEGVDTDCTGEYTCGCNNTTIYCKKNYTCNMIYYTFNFQHKK